MDSQTLLIIAITVVVCALIAVGVWLAVDKARSRRLREQFGPEYDHEVQRMQDRNLAETELQNREQRVRKYRIVPLSSQDRAHYRETWAAVQNRFVDDPKSAVQEGHKQIFEVMEKRGYPVSNFEQAAADLSVDYPELVENYRAASSIAERNRAGEAGTEELRQALVHYRALFTELLEAPAQPSEKTKAMPTARRGGFHFRGFKKGSRGGLRT
jgi:FtsZ-interacting cell division protein ZipA